MNIPKTIEQAQERLGAVGALLTAKQWERAATVAAFVRLSEQNANRHTVATESGRYTPGQFAALGIHGLRSKDTVRDYVQVWLTNNDQTYPEPGSHVDIDALIERVGDWPGIDRRTTADRIAAHPTEKIVGSMTPEQKIDVAAAILQEATTSEDRSTLKSIQDRADIHSVTTKEEFKTVVRGEKERAAATAPLTGLSPLDRVKAFALVELGQDAEAWGGLLAWCQERVAEFAVDGAIREARR